MRTAPQPFTPQDQTPPLSIKLAAGTVTSRPDGRESTGTAGLRGGGPVPAHGVQQPAGGSAPIHGAQHPAVGLDTQLWCSSPGHGAQHPAVWFSTWMQGPAPNCGARHPALGFGTQLWGSAHPCRVQHPAAGLSTQPLALLEQPKGNLVVMETHWQGRISVHLGARSSLDKGSRNKR